MFHDITLGQNGCITPQKAHDLQVRIGKEVAAREAKIDEYASKLENGIIDLKTFETLIAVLNTRMLTEQHESDRRSVEDILHEIERYAYRHAYGRGSSLGLVWHGFNKDEVIGNAPRKTKVVQFHNPSVEPRPRGSYRLKVGKRGWTDHELRAGEERTHEIDGQPWNAINNGDINLDYLDWQYFKIDEDISAGIGQTQTVQFRNQSEDAKGRYQLKLGAGAWAIYDLDKGEDRTHQINGQSWDAENIGKVDLEWNNIDI
jgi:hypothetical protein